MNKNFANYLLNKTKEDYNLISGHFSSSRAIITQDVKDLKKYAKTDDSILDLGCGNGRFWEVVRDLNVKYIGADISEGLLKIASKKYPEATFQKIDFLKLPYESNSFDKVYCLAVIHHIPSCKYQKIFLSEIYRVLKPDGKLILTSWYLLYKKEIIFQIIKNTFKKILGSSKLDFKDVYIPFKNSKGENMATRYIHCFSQREISSLLTKSGFSTEELSYNSRGNKIKSRNILAVARK